MANNIYIISLSPAIDYILKFDELKMNKTNRPNNVEMYPAGKGIHISMLLNNLKVKNESIIFSNGDFEKFFYKNLDLMKIKYKKFNSLGEIRINLKLIDQNQTECSVTSSEIENSELEKLMQYLKENVSTNDYVIATGSIPTGVNNKIYAQIAELTNSLNAHCVIDAFGDSLKYAIEKRPFLIKPNIEELSITTGSEIKNQNDILKAAKQLLDKGVQNILISMGDEGAIFLNKEITQKCSIGNWNKQLVNAAGAGDSMLGGFLSEYIKTKDYTKALKMGIVCGSATAYSDKIASLELIEEMLLSMDSLKIINIE
ncbi:1-phosphofructokinase family hexose kinase [Spiroplasma taiwanense]|uniref:1-phosphofructokinase n=1 Tax=Spiroplasma taiwanense CT-1 TaxID=1276220 RepID=S5M043_9MOLU|nr:1-phosphofructokinase family hexose kinase [Spiroplasma taiwanense]AGR41372.1 1-phosphofructokinase [Spiroplasma taiwanense CT-1]